MADEKLLPCAHCGGPAFVNVEASGERSKYWVECGSCGACSGEYLTVDESAGAWNYRTAVTDHDFAMAVHDGELWGKCSKCKERQGYYLDAETIRNQQERIAKLTVERDAYFEMVKRVQADCDARDELIRDMAEFGDGDWRYTPLSRTKHDDMRREFSERLREFGIEVSR